MIYLYFFSAVTVLSLVSGLVFMAVGGKINHRYSTRLMTMRVVMQAFVILTLAILFIDGS